MSPRCDRCGEPLLAVEETDAVGKVLGLALWSQQDGRILLCRDCFGFFGHSEARAREFVAGLRREAGTR